MHHVCWGLTAARVVCGSERCCDVQVLALARTLHQVAAQWRNHRVKRMLY